MSLAYITHPDCLRHEMGQGHPECPARLRAIEDRPQQRLTLGEVAVDVLDLDGRVVDEDADREREAAEGHHVDRGAERPHAQQRDDHRERDVDRDEDRRAVAAQKQQDHRRGQQHGDHALDEQAVDRAVHELRLVGQQLDLEAGGRGGLEDLAAAIGEAEAEQAVGADEGEGGARLGRAAAVGDDVDGDVLRRARLHRGGEGARAAGGDGGVAIFTRAADEGAALRDGHEDPLGATLQHLTLGIDCQHGVLPDSVGQRGDEACSGQGVVPELALWVEAAQQRPDDDPTDDDDGRLTAADLKEP